MISETMETIHRLSNERHTLYRLAARHHLTTSEQSRIGEITNQLEILWDRHRRELAAQRSPAARIIPLEDRRAA